MKKSIFVTLFMVASLMVSSISASGIKCSIAGDEACKTMSHGDMIYECADVTISSDK